MDILVGERGQGKTKHLIRMSAAGEGTIVTFSEQEARRIKADAKSMKLDIPDPISWSKFIKPGRRMGPYLLDELGGLLDMLGITTATLDSQSNISALTCYKQRMPKTPDVCCEEKMDYVRIALAIEILAYHNKGYLWTGDDCKLSEEIQALLSEALK